MRQQTRRGFVATCAGTVAASLAGCLGSATGGDDPADGTRAAASFFVFGDIARHVAGDVATAETLVPTGQHGHGWEPGPDVQGRVLQSDLFVHAMSGFQPWADDIRTSLDADGADVMSVDITADIDLHELGPDGGHAHGDHEEDHADEHDETHTDEHDDGHSDDHTETHAHEESHDGHEEHNTSEEDHHDTTAEHGHDESDAHDHDTEDEHNHDTEDEHDHDHGNVDPHFWLDPKRVQTATQTLRDAFQSIDDTNADAYAANAAAYEETLSDLDSAFESGLESRTRDVVLVAGHNAYGYLEDRYDLTVVTLSGLSPDDDPTPRDIERAQAAIDEHDIQHILADPLESDRAATQLLAETDATDILPFTSIPGLTTEWTEQDWGYVDIMREVNLPSLRTALGAE
ncbi:zinc ABC transporter substrate-binding protein (plasmid) [Haloferax larsenii]|uniref:Zinc ABC transporter substrate-binding protein n=1 Tax=Haloferax larsenii TaxID=302484 RepID=A0ABY5RJC4_HALLR|nr:zinc ABC transporter substrate-binding protein [Haloferax larsenii]UVE52467.1 zinc ABC transporter substrate-binding protein [Haloferax larsenii]